MNQATQTGAASTQQPHPDVKSDELVVRAQSPRDIALEAMAVRQDEAYAAEVTTAVEGDPGAAVLQNRIVEQQAQSRTDAEAEGLLTPLDENDGAASLEQMHPEPAQEIEPVPDELKSDPLVDHIVMDEGAPMFALKINGENVLMPLDEAKRKLQIGTAAEIRMQEASKLRKELDERERKVSAGEQALQQRVAVQPEVTPSVPVRSDLNEDEIRTQARDVFNTAFSGTEEEAADKLTKLLMKTRAPQAVSAAPLDEAAIVSRAAQAAVGAVNAVNQKKDLVTGYESFKTEYPDIMGDANLYYMTDSMTDGIAQENPEWSKTQVMLEAGKRTREWVESLKGPVSIIEETVTTEDEVISEPTQSPTAQDRQERKAQLVRMPQTATAAINSDSKEPEEKPQTPSQALDDLRRSRGQPI